MNLRFQPGSLIGPFRPVICFILFGILTLLIARIGFIAWQWERVLGVDGLWPVITLGIRMDLILLSYIVMLPVLIALLIPAKGILGAPAGKITRVWLTFFSMFLVFMEAATPSFINEYGARPNRIFLEYLIYPKEVFSTLWAEYKPQLAVGVLLTVFTAIAAWKLYGYAVRTAPAWSWKKRLIAAPLIILLLVLFSRSSLGHRPANISTAAFSGDHLINDLALSSGYSMLYSLYRMKDEANSSKIYGKMEREEIIRRVRGAMEITGASFNSDSIPTLHTQEVKEMPGRPHNLVIVLEESFGAEFVSELGGLPLAPEMEKLADDGLWFENLFATGTRSVRGIEAVTTGFLPTPARSVVKLGLSGNGFFTLASLLKEKGYTTEFIYGGESHFDNMRGFFLGNGFDRVIDQKDYKDPAFTGTWGVSDEDLFDRAHEEFIAHGDKPFFTLVFTSSNHSPFEIPQGKIAPGAPQESGRHRAVRYADYALGRFFEKVRTAPYRENTVFLVVADHNSRVRGASLVPVKRFHIPGIIMGPGIAPGRYKPVASQIDLAPTLLSMIGVGSDHPMVGRDLTRSVWNDGGRAIMQYGENQAYMQKDRVVLFQPKKKPSLYRYRNGELEKSDEMDEELVNNAHAHALWPSLAYRERLYRMPETQGESQPGDKLKVRVSSTASPDVETAL